MDELAVLTGRAAVREAVVACGAVAALAKAWGTLEGAAKGRAHEALRNLGFHGDGSTIKPKVALSPLPIALRLARESPPVVARPTPTPLRKREQRGNLKGSRASHMPPTLKIASKVRVQHNTPEPRFGNN